MNTIGRRQFLIAASATLATARLAEAARASNDNPICVFTKPFQSLSYDELAERVAELGFDGIEAPIRDGGHIEPHQVPDELPKLVEALRNRGLDLTVMASSINDPRDPMTEKVLRTAAAQGVKRYRLKYFHYDFSRPVAAQLRSWHDQLQDLAALNAEIGIRGVYQNHASERMMGAAIWDLAKVLDGIAPDQLGVAYDIRHATVEGGMSWPATFRMIRPHIDTVYVKDFVWGKQPQPENVPLGEGRVDPHFFELLAEADFSGPISLHEEYIDHRKPELVPQHWAAIEKDLAALRKFLGEA